MVRSAQLSNPNLWAPAISRIKLLHDSILDHAKISLDNAILIGEILSGIRSTIKHGEWLPWLEMYAPFSESTARNYIRLFDNKDVLKSATVVDLASAYSLLLSSANNGSAPGQPQQLHEPNFHSQAVRLRQNLVGLFNHYLQRRPLKIWNTEEIFDLLSSLKPLSQLCDQLQTELSSRPDAPSSDR